MEIRKEELRVRSSDNDHDLFGIVYLPENEPRGIFQIVHGMIEHIGRYDRYAGVHNVDIFVRQNRPQRSFIVVVEAIPRGRLGDN